MKIVFLIIFSVIYGIADSNTTKKNKSTSPQTKTVKLDEKNSTKTKEDELKRKKEEEERLKKEEKIAQINGEKTLLLKELDDIDAYLNENNVWSKIYSNYETYNKLEFLSIEMEKRIKELKSKKKLTKKEKKALKKYEEDYQTTKGKLAQLKEYKENPFKKILTPEEIGDAPAVLSPLDIIKAISFQKRITAIGDEYSSRFQSLKDTLSRLIRKKIILMRLTQLNKELNVTNDKYREEIGSLSKQIKVYNQTLDIFKTTQKALNRKISELKLNISKLISKEIEKGIVLGSIILFLFLVFLILKYLVRKYMSEKCLKMSFFILQIRL